MTPNFRVRPIQPVPTWSLTIPAHLAERLFAHLFPGDDDEHGAVLLAGVAETPDGRRLLVREVIIARDGIEYVPGRRGYRMLTGEFVTRQIRRCRDERLVYLAVHNHGGTDIVEFSGDDLASHRRGYPALLDIVKGLPVGALVFASNAVAGELWTHTGEQIALSSARILGRAIYNLVPNAKSSPRTPSSAIYDRQSRLFGDKGQEILSRATVGVIGAGGVGSLVVEFLARLGVGSFIIVDPDRIEISNVPRVTGATKLDAMSFLTAANRPDWLRRLGSRLSTPKVKVMRRLIRRANPHARVETILGNIVDDSTARRFTRCDYLFLAADSMQARLVFNAIVHAYLIPGVQMGAKVPVDQTTGDVGDVFSIVRPVTPSSGCLMCNGFITADGLAREAESEEERRVQRYVQDSEVVAPSVISLNAVAASHAVDDFLFALTALTRPDARVEYFKNSPRRRRIVFEEPRCDPSCPQCGRVPGSAFALGDAAELYTAISN